MPVIAFAIILAVQTLWFLLSLAVVVYHNHERYRGVVHALNATNKKVSQMATNADLTAAVTKLNAAIAANDAKLVSPVDDAAVAAVNAAADHLNPPAPATTDAPPVTQA